MQSINAFTWPKKGDTDRQQRCVTDKSHFKDIKHNNRGHTVAWGNLLPAKTGSHSGGCAHQTLEEDIFDECANTCIVWPPPWDQMCPYVLLNAMPWAFSMTANFCVHVTMSLQDTSTGRVHSSVPAPLPVNSLEPKQTKTAKRLQDRS